MQVLLAPDKRDSTQGFGFATPATLSLRGCATIATISREDLHRQTDRAERELRCREEAQRGAAGCRQI
jgi:hypothetical protein